MFILTLGAIHKRRPQKSGDFRPPSPPLSEFVHIRLTPPPPPVQADTFERFCEQNMKIENETQLMENYSQNNFYAQISFLGTLIRCKIIQI